MRSVLLRWAVAAALASRMIGDVGAGTITGEVKFLDSPPKPAPIKVSKDQDYCGDTLPNETYVIDPDGALKNVVVFIEAAPAATTAPIRKSST